MQGNLRLMTGLQQVQSRLRGAVAKQPLLAGPSRKGFLGKLTGQCDCSHCKQMLLTSELTESPFTAGHEVAADRDCATAIAAALCLQNGASIIRAHNASAARDAVRILDAVRQAAFNEAGSCV